MLEDYKKYYYGRTDMTMLNDEKVYGSLGINLKKVTTIVEGAGSLMLPNSLKAPLERVELIGNSVQGENPAPDNPQEIKSVGRKSNNLLIENISVFTVQDNIAYIPLPEGHETKLYTMLIQKKPGENDDVGFTCGFYDKSNMAATYSTPCLKDGNLVAENGIVNSKVGVNHFICFSPADSKFFDIYNVMYVEGKETALDYEPYGYLLDVKVTGKNLLSNKPTDWMIGKATSWGAVPQTPVSYGTNVKNAIATINVKSSTNYSFINKETNKLWVCRIIELDANGLGLVNHALYANESFNYKKYNFSTRSNTANIVFEIKKVDNTELLSTDIESNKIMLVEGEVNEPTPYEPYAEQFMQIVLNEPLRGIGEYKDTITKDGVVRKIKRAVFDGSENEKWGLSREHENHINFALVIKGAITVNTGIRTMMDKFKYFGAIWNSDLLGQDMFGATLRINMPKTLATDLQTFKTWLSQNPLTVDYVLAEPVTEPLPESVQQQLQALHSENGTTHVFVDSGEVEAGIKVEYVVGA